ncbi:6-phosphogluconolactonase [Ascodesmis nigricans]|uniref:6-phosphogluconolactonase n=1 Tax=Ascodesmis nigricans TaxID=341454 RepID=A0A4S2N5H8_9PEZI|nr:6-phosphogluconolactonase [Ascodesmis nigricans]
MSKQPILYSFPENDALQDALFTFVLSHQNSALHRHHVFRIAVSGGSLPKMLASEKLLTSPEIQWDKWQIFFADERAVPLDHEDSNYALLKSELLDKIPADKPQPTVVPIDEKQLNNTQELADNYEQALVRYFAAKDSVKLPIFDLILLGCGPDGHTCSLFPEHELLRENIAWVAPIDDSPKPPKSRITLTLPVVTHALTVAFVATGEGKKEVMRKIFDSENGEGLPCALVNSGSRDRVVWFCDNKATEGVLYQKKSSL